MEADSEEDEASDCEDEVALVRGSGGDGDAEACRGASLSTIWPGVVDEEGGCTLVNEDERDNCASGRGSGDDWSFVDDGSEVQGCAEEAGKVDADVQGCGMREAMSGTGEGA